MPRVLPLRRAPGRPLLATCLALALAGVAGCAQSIPPPGEDGASDSGPTVSAYAAELEPAAAVLPLVPASATTLMVTDYDRVRLQLGRVDLDGNAPAAASQAFWQRAEGRSPILVRGSLAGSGSSTREPFGFTRDDVRWEAEFSGPDGNGTVLGFREGVDMAGVGNAVKQGAIGLDGAKVRAEDRLLVLRGADDPAESWGAYPGLVSLVGPAAISTYVERGCVGADQLPQGIDPDARLDELKAWAIQLQGGVATARLLGSYRRDLFERIQLAQASDSAFTDAFTGGVADPSTGRIGFRITDGVRAAELTRSRLLPFAACGG